MGEKLYLPQTIEDYLFLLCTGALPRISEFQAGANFVINSADPARLSGIPEGIEPPPLTSWGKSKKSVQYYPTNAKRVGFGVDVGAIVNGEELHNLKRNGDPVPADVIESARQHAYEMYCYRNAVIVWIIGMSLLSDDNTLSNVGAIEIAARYNKLDRELVDREFDNENVINRNTRLPMIELAKDHAQWLTAKEFFGTRRRRPISQELAQRLIVGGLPTQPMLDALSQRTEESARFSDGVHLVRLPLRS